MSANEHNTDMATELISAGSWAWCSGSKNELLHVNTFSQNKIRRVAVNVSRQIAYIASVKLLIGK